MEHVWPRRIVDYAVPAGLLVLGLTELASLDIDGRRYAAAAEVVAALLLVFRATHPLVCATAAGVVTLSPPLVGPALDEAAATILFMIVAIYSLGRHVAGLRGAGGVALILLWTLAIYLTVDPREHSWSDVVFVLAFAVPPYVFGRVTRRLAEQGELLRQNQELVRRDAVRAERDRIARELHDVIAHSVSAMVVQTAAAQDLVRTDPDTAERVLADVAATGRRAVSETGRLLHAIRDEGDELGLGPAPGVAQLPELVEQFRAGGMAVDYSADPLPALPPGLDVSVYRIVQEALTNALKHGRGRRADLRVSARDATLSIRTANPTDGGSGGGSGLGLVGIAERVSLLGGRMRHGSDPSGRFELDVTLPLTPVEPA